MCTHHGEGNLDMDHADSVPVVPSPTTPWEGPCAVAQRLVHTARIQAYGHPADNFTDIARLWSVITGTPISVQQVVDMMVALKLARNVHRRDRENWVDVAGYVEAGALAELELTRRAQSGS